MQDQKVETGRISSGTSTAQVGDTYKSSPVSPLDGIAIQPTIIQFDYRVYQDEVNMWRKSQKNIEDLCRLEMNKMSMAKDTIRDQENAIKVLRQENTSLNDAYSNTIYDMNIGLERAGIKLIRLRNAKGYRVVILKRKPKKK